MKDLLDEDEQEPKQQQKNKNVKKYWQKRKEVPKVKEDHRQL